jgi:sulfate adenylyltransferase subunit 2
MESDANTLEKIVDEVAVMRNTERGNRSDDKRSESAMEDRKRQGYF